MYIDIFHIFLNRSYTNMHIQICTHTSVLCPTTAFTKDADIIPNSLFVSCIVSLSGFPWNASKTGYWFFFCSMYRYSTMSLFHYQLFWWSKDDIISVWAAIQFILTLKKSLMNMMLYILQNKLLQKILMKGIPKIKNCEKNSKCY